MRRRIAPNPGLFVNDHVLRGLEIDPRVPCLLQREAIGADDRVADETDEGTNNNGRKKCDRRCAYAPEDDQ